MKDAIGGYLSLELNKELKPYHGGLNCIALNTGRNCLEYILRVRKYKKVYIPYFTCEVILEPFQKLGVKYEYYSVDENLDPIINYNSVKKDEGFLYTNYFGLKDQKISELSKLSLNLIIDNAQSFFSKPLEGVDTFYSVRKFIGVSDGAYLYMDDFLNNDFETDISHTRIEHLLIRIDQGAEVGYSTFSKNDEKLIGQPIRLMSKLTSAILESVDYDEIRNRRIQNFNFLATELRDLNLLDLIFDDKQIPMVYPYLSKDKKLKKKLFDNRVYCANYWPNVMEWCSEDSLEYNYSKDIIHLPIDQRYTREDMEYIIDIIKN